MSLVVLALLGGLATGAALGGSLGRLGALRVHRVGWLVAAVVLQVVAGFALPARFYAPTLVASLVVAAVFLLGNRDLGGRWLLLAGLAANAVVVAANGGMPVSPAAAVRAGVALGPLAGDARHVIATGGTHLGWLIDRWPLPLPGVPQVLSAGDVLVAAGIGLLVADGMRRRSHEPRPVRPPRPTDAGPGVTTGP